MRFARKELLAIFFFYCFQVAVGSVPSGRPGEEPVLLSLRAAQVAAPPRVGAQTFSPGFRGGQRPTANSDVSLSRAPANPRSVQARGMGSSPTETWNPAARRRALRLGGVSAGQDPLGGQRSLAAEISTLSADQQPVPPACSFRSWEGAT